MSRLVIVSGPPGAGKSTVSKRLAQQAKGPLAMHLHTDDLYAAIKKGFVPPWMPESRGQNLTLMKAMAAQAATCAVDGYEVFIDAVVGPWFFEPWLAAARAHDVALHYVVLMPSEDATVARATARTAAGAMTDPKVAGFMWTQFAGHAIDARHLVDTTDQTPPQTVKAVQDGLTEGRFKLS